MSWRREDEEEATEVVVVVHLASMSITRNNKKGNRNIVLYWISSRGDEEAEVMVWTNLTLMRHRLMKLRTCRLAPARSGERSWPS
jgi:hypothetical protein